MIEYIHKSIPNIFFLKIIDTQVTWLKYTILKTNAHLNTKFHKQTCQTQLVIEFDRNLIDILNYRMNFLVKKYMNYFWYLKINGNKSGYIYSLGPMPTHDIDVQILLAYRLRLANHPQGGVVPSEGNASTATNVENCDINRCFI